MLCTRPINKITRHADSLSILDTGFRDQVRDEAGAAEALEGASCRFQVLEAECLERFEGLCTCGNEEEALRAFGDEAVTLKIEEMEKIVQLFREVKRDRDARRK